MGYNNWLREEAEDSKNMLHKNTVRLQAQLPALESVLLQAKISSNQLVRVSVAMTHLMTEMHLLVTLVTEAD